MAESNETPINYCEICGLNNKSLLKREPQCVALGSKDDFNRLKNECLAYIELLKIGKEPQNLSEFLAFYTNLSATDFGSGN